MQVHDLTINEHAGASPARRHIMQYHYWPLATVEGYMRNTQKKRLAWRFVAAALVLSLGAAACGDDGGSDNKADGTGTSGATAKSGATATPTTLTPVKGGIITVGTYSNAAGLDPAKIAGGGTVGGMENAAIYDTIVRYDNTTGKYEPRTGAFTANADSTVWTLKIKSGIKFQDGTDYNADAVKFVVSREMKDGNSSPKGQLKTFLDADPEKSIKVVDPLTVQFTLKLGWADFPYMFANVQGWIYSPTQFAKVGDPRQVQRRSGPRRRRSVPGQVVQAGRGARARAEPQLLGRRGVPRRHHLQADRHRAGNVRRDQDGHAAGRLLP